MHILLFISFCIYISFPQTFELDDLENFRDLKTGISVEAIDNGDNSLVTLDITSVSRKPFRVSGVSSVSVPSGAVSGTLSNLLDAEYVNSWEQSYSIQFNTLSNCDPIPERDTIFLILTDGLGNTKFEMVNITLNPTCTQSAASLPLTSTIQTYSDSVFTTPSNEFNLGDTVFCRTEIFTPGSTSSVQIASASLIHYDNVYDLTSPEFQLQEYDSATVSLVSFKLAELDGVADGSIITLAMRYSISYSDTFRRFLSSNDAIETSATRKFKIYLSEKCNQIGQIVTKKCEMGGEIVKICQSNGFHIVKDSCGKQEIITNSGSTQSYLAMWLIFMLASMTIGINSFSNPKKKD